MRTNHLKLWYEHKTLVEQLLQIHVIYLTPNFLCIRDKICNLQIHEDLYRPSSFHSMASVSNSIIDMICLLKVS